MSAFLTELQVENATGMDDGKWRLTAPLVYQSDVAGMTFTVPAGFISDYASVPRAPLVYWLCGDTSTMASVVHDAIYTYHWVDRATADAVLKEASAVTGVPAWRRAIMWAAVRAFGASHWDSRPITA
ncbi:DUF1353 domain-containing protein [Paraburkholderia atlantica]|uniref:DUF1353 domain-containing protein n=1 Tax=Paraburkholderia atlantica TaxID=2654982 RepID=UPI0017989D8D|nr:DUF1353 domain-containing protein [Paraburkholderia atlantica]MBB5414134.1 hypothetical protein [Paraburkholderia atlantica]